MTSARAEDRSPILIAGCGYVGTALGTQLAASGHVVYGLRRNASAIPDTIRPISGDLSRPESLGSLPGPFDTVFYTAGSAGHSDDAYRAAYVDGLRNLLDTLTRLPAPPRRLIFTSSTAVYAQTDGSWVDENSPTEPDYFSGKRMLEAESILAGSGLATIAVRLGGIYGPGRTGLIDRVRRGEARREPGPARYLNLIHLEDIVGVLAHLMTVDRPKSVYIGVDDQPQEYNALLEWIAARAGVPSPPYSDAPQTRGRATHNRRCSNARLKESGYRFRYVSAVDGYGAILAAMGS